MLSHLLSTRTPPKESPYSAQVEVKFEPNSSVVLVGTRGTGKSSLALIASSTFGLWRIDFDDHFQRATGSSRLEFKKLHGKHAGTQKELSILKKVLEDNVEGSVIVIPSDFVQEAGLRRLKQFSSHHPVIHVRRSISAVQQYLRPWDPAKVERVIDMTEPLFKSCSNFEFYNLDELEVVYEGHFATPESKLPLPQSLRLKKMEESFKRLISKVLQLGSSKFERREQLPAPAPRAEFTYLLSVKTSEINSPNFSIKSLDCGADACELEIDVSRDFQNSSMDSVLNHISRAFAVLTRYFSGPIIYHVLSTNIASSYTKLLDHGIRLGFDYLTIDLEHSLELTDDHFSARGFSGLIGHFHDENPEPNAWLSEKRWQIYHKACLLGLHGVRLTQRCRYSADNEECASFVVLADQVRSRRPFLIAYNTGILGRQSQCFNKVLTRIQHSSKKDPLLPQCLPITIQQSQKALYASYVYASMQYFIVGLDVSYALSPDLHNTGHKYFGMPHHHEQRSMSSLDSLSELLEIENLGGISFGQGYKQSILPHLAMMSVHARRIGAINTLMPIRTSSLEISKHSASEFWATRNQMRPALGFYGDNLDWVGMRAAILPKLSPANVITRDSAALVIGAGGMARAALYALIQMGLSHIAIYNRTIANAKSLAQEFENLDWSGEDPFPSPGMPNGWLDSKPEVEIRVLESLDAEWFTDISQPTIIISCLPALSGMEKPGIHFELPSQWTTSRTGGVVMDTNYHPLVTALIRQTQNQAHRGWVPVNGLENLAAQCLVQFEVFTGRKLPDNFMRASAVRSYLHHYSHDEEAREILDMSGMNETEA